jgi:hypothetical protein
VLVAYFAFSVLVIAVCTVEVTLQACARVKRTDAMDVDCRSGVLSLMQAVERATRQASTGTRPEREAVLAYRAALEPEWSRREAIRSVCEGDPGLEETLDAVLHLGWAEERAVRRDSLETTDFRRRAHELVSRHIRPDAIPAGSASSSR